MQTLQRSKDLILNTDINILSNLPDYSFLKSFFDPYFTGEEETSQASGEFKTIKSLKRFEAAVKKSFLTFPDSRIEQIVTNAYKSGGLSDDVFMLLFWNLSINNDLFSYLNEHVYFPALYSGRVAIRTGEVQACLKELQENNQDVKSWTSTTINETSSSYLRILKKLNLMVGAGATKTIKSPFLSDKQFVLFIYILKVVEEKNNILESEWIPYSFCERPIFIERTLQKKFSNFFELTYSGDKLTITTILPYSEIYNAIK